MLLLLEVLLCVVAVSVLSQQTVSDDHSSDVLLFNLGRTTSDISKQGNHISRRYLTEEGPDAPLYRGFGTHFVYVYVGTPRQRVSVIVDTGSHHTAFPCSGCSQCGDHTDLYFNPKKSTSIVVPKCSGKNCVFSQSYTEGSMWTAYRVRDKFFIGGETVDMAPGADKHDVEFTFGCQTKETGLFRTQMENGIMGLSADAKTLPNTLYKANVTKTNAFALCFLPNGGVMSLGGSHPQLKQGPMVFAQMTKKSGYFTVRVLSMFLRKAESTDLTELKMPMTKLNSGKGVIVDSGTTDTYLPSAISSAFQSLFKKLCGISYTRSNFALSAEDVKKLPTVVFRLQKWHSSGKSNEFVQVEMPPTRYLELSNKNKKNGKEMYVFRLYLTERSGGVLGANFMIGQNIEFDQKKLRVGFAPSHCKGTSGDLLYKGMSKPVKMKKHLRKLDHYDYDMDAIVPMRRRLSSQSLRPSGPCNAVCRKARDGETSPIVHSTGFMPAIAADNVQSESEGAVVGKIGCSIACNAETGLQVIYSHVDGQSHHGDDFEKEVCPLSPWSRCGQDCTQTREISIGSNEHVNQTCWPIQTASRKCWRELCPFNPREQCAFRLQLSVPLFKAKKWNSLWKEDIISAMAMAIEVRLSY